MLFESRKERRKSRAEKILKEIIAENFPNMAKYINLWSQEAEQTLNNLNDSGFLIRNNGNQEQVAQHFSSTERFLSSENTFQK